MSEYISESLSLRLGAEFTLLRTPLFAGVGKEGADGFEVLVMPTDSVAGPGMTIAEMVRDINTLMGKDALQAEEVQSKLASLNPNSNIKFETIQVCLCQAFVYYKSKNSAGQSEFEYALSVVVNASELLPADMGLININRLTLSVWNTTRPMVVARMGLADNKQLLGG